MNETEVPQNPLQPTIEAAPPPPVISAPPAETTPTQTKRPGSPEKLFRSSVPFAIAAAAIICGISLFFIYQKFFHKEPPEQITTVIITPTPTPTPIRYPTAVSQTADFKAEQDSIASVTASLEDFSKDDPSLSPPSLVLPLGF